MAAPILPYFSFSSARWEKNGIVWDRRQNGEGIPEGQRITGTPLRGIPGRRGHRLGVDSDQPRIRGNRERIYIRDEKLDIVAKTARSSAKVAIDGSSYSSTIKKALRKHIFP